MRIDIHAHWIPGTALEAFHSGRLWHGSEMGMNAQGFPTMVTEGKRSTVGSTRHFDGVTGRLEDMDADGIDLQVLSVLPPFFRYALDADLARSAARAINDDLKAFIDEAPQRFEGWGHLPLQADPDTVERELEYIVETCTFAGVAMGTHVAGVELGNSRFDYLWAALAERRVPVFLHPPAGDRRALDLPQGFFLENVIGNPVETTLSLASIVLNGILERHPSLVIVAAHGGGYFPAALGRVRHAAGVREETGRKLRSGLDQASIGGIYVDTITHSAAALRFLVDEVGHDHLLLGTDYPSDMSLSDPVGEVSRALSALPHEELADVLGETANRVLLMRN